MVKTTELVIFMVMDKDKDKLVELINKKISNKVFTIDKPFYEMESVIPSLKFKVKVVRIKEMISVGEWKPYLIYDMYIYPLEGTIPSFGDRFQNTLEDIFNMAKEQNMTIENVGGIFNRIIRLGNMEVVNFIKIFDMGGAAMRNAEFIQDNKINESYIVEGKYDGITRTLVKDIIDLYKKNDEGEFDLPEDLRKDEMVYDFGGNLSSISVELELTQDKNIDDYEVDAEYYRGEDTIIIQIIYNPKNKMGLIQNLIGDLNETVRHELEHVKQYYQGYKFPKEPKSPVKYYTRKHEIEAQLAGFKRRAKQEKKPLPEVLRNWFDKNKKRHKLSDDQVDKVIKKLLTYPS